MRRLLRPFLVLLALLFLLEAWLWEHLAPIVAWIVARVPLRALKAHMAAAVDALPPTATLGVFLLPVIMLLPLKVLGLWMLAHGFWLGAVGVLALTKVVSLGVTAFVFDLTRPKLLQLAWFRQVYDLIIRWLDWAHALVDPIKLEIKRVARLFAPAKAGRTWRLLTRIRRRMQGPPASA